MINPKNKDNERLKHSIIAAVNHEKIKNNPEKYLIFSLLLINIIGRG